MYQYERIQRYILNEVETSHHLITEEYFYFPHLVVWGRYCACEMLIANPIDWLYAAFLEYFILIEF
jgi:hypothetical protein